MSTWSEFKAFAFKGNVLDLATAIVIGAAFLKVVTTLVDAIILPLVAKLLPTGSFATWAPAGVKLGLLVAAVIDFLIVAFALFVAVTFLRRRRWA